MFTKLTTSQRIQVGLVLAVAFLMVLGSNRLDRQHFSTIQNTVNSVHEDRVVVQDFIYRLTKIVHQKELRLVRNSKSGTQVSHNQNIDELLLSFRATQLTPSESNMLHRLNRQFLELRNIEDKIAVNTKTSEEDLAGIALKKLDVISQNLDGLADIQVTESSQMTQSSNKSLGMNLMLSNLELGFMIVIGIAMLVLIFSPVPMMQLVP
ncbi:MAG: hypothetical protein WA913_03470 [Pricia sp.]